MQPGLCLDKVYQFRWTKTDISLGYTECIEWTMPLEFSRLCWTELNCYNAFYFYRTEQNFYVLGAYQMH